MTIDESEKLRQSFGAYAEVDPEYYTRFNVKRGLRNSDGTGVVAGITSVSSVHGYYTDEGVRIPSEGRLTIRGIDINDLVDHVVGEKRFGYEEMVCLLWGGKLPAVEQLNGFKESLGAWRDLPKNFVASSIMNAPAKDTMNMLARSVLLLYAYDDNADDTSLEHEVDTAIQIVSRLPRLAALSYLAYGASLGKPFFLNPPQEGLSTAETVLYMLRQDREWTEEEARMLDIMLMLHAEHGGGNNSTFTTRVLTSSGTDAYSAYAGGICSLKGPRHGGANIKALNMQDDLKAHVADFTDEGQVADYLAKVIHKEANDGSGLIYGMGHAVYTKSDPRAAICKRYAKKLAQGTEFEGDFQLIETIERLTPEVFGKEKGSSKVICANIDMYSGLVYRMLGIPTQLFTPLFAVARCAGWAAHRFEEMARGKRIIRPAYKTVDARREYVPMSQRGGENDRAQDQIPLDNPTYTSND